MTTIQQDKNELERNMLKLIDEFHEKHPGHLFSHATLITGNPIQTPSGWKTIIYSLNIEIRVK